ncbi:MAG: hypothetical protein VR72_07375 [Clostridiaceae bacterium BRH_c20a]|nr:MAG: hypothetical protein VR72_07375 [Clostridiaceae bacterium BRH_c20a]
MISKKLNILVTGIGGDIGIGIVSILNKIQYHSTLIGCDINNYPASKNQVDFFYNAPSAKDQGMYIDFLNKLCSKHNIDLIIPSSEIEIKVLSKTRNFFDENQIKLLINNDHIIDIFMDKLKTIKFFEENKIFYPKTFLFENFEDQLDYPFLVKRKFTAGSKGIFIVEDAQDLEYYRKKYSDSIVQEIVGDSEKEYTIGVFSDGNKTFNIAFQRKLGFGSLSRFVKLVNDPKIDELAKNISNFIHLKGSINIQVRKDEKGEYIPFEINPRLSSTLAFRSYFGFEDLKWWIDMIYGDEIEYKPIYKAGIGVKTLSEIYFELEEREEQ